jgi:hypothetical protein
VDNLIEKGKKIVNPHLERMIEVNQRILETINNALKHKKVDSKVQLQITKTLNLTAGGDGDGRKNIPFAITVSALVAFAAISPLGVLPPSFFSQPAFAQSSGGSSWTEGGRYTVADETVHIGPDHFYYYPFYTNAPVATLAGYYQELTGRELMVTVYDASTCNVPYGSYGFDITTCTSLDANVYNEIQSEGNPNINLYPGKYFLTVEPASYEDVNVRMHFELIGYVPANISDDITSTQQQSPTMQSSSPADTSSSTTPSEESDDDDASGLNRCLITPNYGPWILSPPVCY